MTQKRANRLNDIISCISGAGDSGMLRRELAECLKLKVTPHLIGYLEQLVMDGWLRKEQDHNFYPVPWRYFVTEKVRGV